MPPRTRLPARLLALAMGLAASPAPAEPAPGSPPAGRTAAEAHLERMQKRYAAIASLSLEFRERFVNRATGTTIEESGHLLASRPGRMRWEYRQPESKLFVLSGDTAWFYVPDDEVAYRLDACGEDSRSLPTRFLAGEGDLVSDFTAAVEDASPASLRLRLVPRTDGEGYDYLVVEIDPESAAIRSLAVIDALGNRTEFRFADERHDLPVARDAFRFDPPAGIDVVRRCR